MTADIEKTLSRADSAEKSCSSGGESPILESIEGVETNRCHSHSPHSLASTEIGHNGFYRNLEHAVSATVETEAERAAREPITYTWDVERCKMTKTNSYIKSGASINSVAPRPPEYEVYFEPNDLENP